MECADCDRSPNCPDMIDWRKMYAEMVEKVDRLEAEESKQSDEGRAITDRAVKAMLKTSADRENEYWSKRAEETSKELLNDREWKAVYDKPPLVCKPPFLTSGARIKELSEAITRTISGCHKDYDCMRKCAKEILYHLEIMENC